jgi:hypothetical protein
VLVLLQDAEWSKKSDGWIAEHAAVTDRYVAKIRKDTGANSSPLRERHGRDGKTYALPQRKAGQEPRVEALPTAAEAPAEDDEDGRTDEDRDPAQAAVEVATGRTQIPAPAAPQRRAAQPEKPVDPFCGCGSAMRLQAVEAWAEQGEMLFKILGDAGKDHMLNEWARRVKRLEGYAA